MTTENQIEDVAHEVISSRISPNDIPALEAAVKAEIEKFSIANAGIAELKETYGGLTIEKDGLKKVKEGRSVLRNRRLSVEKLRKELKEPHLTLGRAIDREATRITTLLQDIEQPLDLEIKAEEERKAAEKEKAQYEAALAFGLRISKLLQSGATFDGNYYTIGSEISLSPVELKNIPDSEFERLIEAVKAESDAIKQREAEQREKERQEREELKRQREEMAAALASLQVQEHQKNLDLAKEVGEKMANSMFPLNKLQPENDLAVLDEHHTEQNTENSEVEQCRTFAQEISITMAKQPYNLQDAILLRALSVFDEKINVALTEFSQAIYHR